MDPRRIALALVVVGTLCLPAPLYLGAAASVAAPPQQTSQIYTATPVDVDTSAGREAVVSGHVTGVALSVHQVSERYSAGEYRAPTVTRTTLEAAMEDGSATTDDPAAMADLRAIAREYTFVYDAYSDEAEEGREGERYYRLRVRDDGSTVRATNVSLDRVANETVEQVAVDYDDLSAGERRTVDNIIANTSSDGYGGYRPRVDDPFVDRLPALVRKDGTLYSLQVFGHVDDFGPGFFGFIAGLVVAAVGGALIIVAGTAYVLLWWRDRAEG